MKEFETLTELELLNLAYDTLLDRWYKETKFLETCPNKHNTIAEARIKRCDAKMDELHARILELETAEQN